MTRRDFWHMTSGVASIESLEMRSVFAKALNAVADLWPAISPADSDHLRKRRIAVRGCHLATALLVVAAIVGTIIRGTKVFSAAETVGLVLLGSAAFHPDASHAKIRSWSRFLIGSLTVLKHLVCGKSNKEIASNIAEGTVKNHITNSLGKLGVLDRTQAALKAKEMGLA